jgi:transcriptional regulator with PAS, ATPase and Fis domain
MQEELQQNQPFDSIIGKTPEMNRIFEMVKKAADTKASVLITGESGTGKELIADALHHYSSRCDKPLVKVHCAALSENLLESELFGHEKGAFTGAVARKRGRFELASGGTIFLDEIGEIDQNVQIKILRVLQDKRFERVGGEETLEVDVRVIAATNRDLLKEIEEGRFREDLYYRLNVVQIHLPPLRERKDDIPLMIASFLAEFTRENGKNITAIDARTRTALYKYDWPGNIRQLKNCIESAVVMCSGSVITADDLPPGIAGNGKDETIAIPAGLPMNEAEKILIMQNLAINKGNKSKTADVLGIGRKTLHRKLDEYEEGA